VSEALAALVVAVAIAAVRELLAQLDARARRRGERRTRADDGGRPEL